MYRRSFSVVLTALLAEIHPSRAIAERTGSFRGVGGEGEGEEEVEGEEGRVQEETEPS